MRSITAHIDATTLIPDSCRTNAPPAPKSVKIELGGNACNYACSFCTLRHRPQSYPNPMDWKLFTRIATEMYEAGVKEIGLFYINEPFYHSHVLVKGIEFCKKLGFEYVFITTNGSLAKPEVMEQAFKAGLDSVKFSVNFYDTEQFQRITGRPSVNYIRALANLKSARVVRDQGGYDCGIYASYIQFDGSQAGLMESVLDEHVRPYVDECYALPLYSFGGGEISGVGKPTAGNQGRIGALRDGLPCWSLWEGHIRASPDGKKAYLSACCFGSDDRFDVADLTQVSFMDAWHSEKFQDLRAAHLCKDVKGTVCEKCLAFG